MLVLYMVVMTVSSVCSFHLPQQLEQKKIRMPPPMIAVKPHRVQMRYSTTEV